jgi:branched-chain amino acid transport system permease protein
MLGGYIGTSYLALGLGFWPAALLAGLSVAVIGALFERLLLRRLAGSELAQVLVTLGLSLMIADSSLMFWGGDPVSVAVPPALRGSIQVGDYNLAIYRLSIVAVAAIFAVAIWLIIDKTRIGAMIRAGVDDIAMARVTGIRVSLLFSLVFAVGAGLAGFAGVIGAPVFTVYPGLDNDMLPLALVVVIVGGIGSLPGSLAGSILVAFLNNFGQAYFPELAYVVLFLPMLLILMVRPQGLFGRISI